MEERKNWETDGYRNGQPVYCPFNAYCDCLYCDSDYLCHIADPVEDCTDFQAFFPSWQEWEDADNVDDDAPTDFSEDEIEWARQRYGYNEDYDVGYDPFSGSFTDDC